MPTSRICTVDSSCLLQDAAAQRVANIIHVRVKFISAILCKVRTPQTWRALYIPSVHCTVLPCRLLRQLAQCQVDLQVAVEFVGPALLLLAWSTFLLGVLGVKQPAEGQASCGCSR